MVSRPSSAKSPRSTGETLTFTCLSSLSVALGRYVRELINFGYQFLEVLTSETDGANDRGTYAADVAVHVTVTVAVYGEGVGEGVVLFGKSKWSVGGLPMEAYLARFLEDLFWTSLSRVKTSSLGLWTQVARMHLNLWDGNVGQRMSSNRPGTRG